MDEIIWIEVLSRHREVVARFRCVGPELRIGRGYANDVVIDDPRIAAQHLRILRAEDGALIAEDLGSTNGLYDGPGHQRLQRIILNGDRPIRIGNTYLRVREAGHAVAPERLSATSEWHAKPALWRWGVALALGVAALAVASGSLWLNEVAEPKASRYLLPLLAVGVLALIWTGIWSVLSHIFTGQTRFDRHLVIALAGLLGFALSGEFAGLVAFSFPAIAPYQYVAFWCILAAVSFFHLRVIAPARLKLASVVVTTLLAMAVSMQTLTQSDLLSGSSQPAYLWRLMPPALRLAPLQTETAFFADVEDIKGKLDRDRLKEPTASARASARDGNN